MEWPNQTSIGPELKTWATGGFFTRDPGVQAQLHARMI
jgi:hypothetical protein